MSLFKYNIYRLKILVTIVKYMTIEQVSTMVVINGAAIIAGSIFNLFANKGSMHPIIFDKTIVHIKVNPIATAKIKS